LSARIREIRGHFVFFDRLVAAFGHVALFPRAAFLHHGPGRRDLWAQLSNAIDRRHLEFAGEREPGWHLFCRLSRTR
ncbi:MAG TPA: hypothetical protein VKU82_15190, partial [Planctomycetaceae bacterium]|nr:hypothetical protein [Planctomycetaceae bacterium]